MTVESSKNKAGPFLVTGTSGTFPRDFLLIDEDHLRIIRVRGEVETDLTVGISHTGIGTPDGTVTITAGIEAGDQVYLLRSVPKLQRSDYSAQGRVRADQVESDFDILAMQVQDLSEVQSRALTAPISSKAAGEDVIRAALDAPRQADRAEKAADAAEAVVGGIAYLQDLVTQSEGARDKSQEWADKAVDAPVEPGKYSALHHAAKSESAQISAETAEAGANAARLAAEAARDAATVNAQVYADTAAGLAATTAGDQFQVVAGDEIIRYRHDAGPVATPMVRFPSSSIVQNIGLLTGIYDETALYTTYGDTSFNEASFTNAAIYASDAVTDIASRLISISVRVSSAGTGRFIVYSANGDGTYENVGVYPASFAAAGDYSFVAGGGVIPAGVILPAGSFVAYERVTTSHARGKPGAGAYYTITGDAGLGSTVTRTLGGSSAISIAFTTGAFEETIGARADAAVTSAENALNRIGQPAGSAQEIVQTIGDASGTSGVFNAGTFASPDLVTTAGPLKSVSVRVNSAGGFELHHMRRVSATTWECIAVWPAAVGAVGLHEFVAGESSVPLGVSMEFGDFIAFKSGTARLQYGGATGATWALINNATGFGAIVTRTINTNNFRASIAFTVGEPTRTLESRIFELEDRLAYLTTPVGSTSAYALGDSAVAEHAGGTAIMGLIDSARMEVDLSVPGHKIADQQLDWLNRSVSRLSVGWVIVQIGLNDLNPAEAASAAIARLQGLVNIIRSEIGPYRPLFISQLIPCRQRLINLYGATNGPIAYQKWLDMNAAIAGTGPTPITNVTARITEHVALLNDGAGNLLPAYDTGDGIHPNTAGRQVNASAWENALIDVGLVV